MSRVAGHTADLKPSQARALQRLSERKVPPSLVASPTLARDLLELSHALNRQLGLYIDRRGRVQRLIVGTAHDVDLPEFDRVRGAEGRLRGIRLVLTHLAPTPLSREELADLLGLRLDLLAVAYRSPAGVMMELACIEPALDDPHALRTRTWPPVPLTVLERAAEDQLDPRDAEHWPDLPAPFGAFVRELEQRLDTAAPRTHRATGGARAVALMVHAGGRAAAARKAELRELCRTANIDLVELFEQRRPHPDPRTFMGSGKLREVLVHALEQDAELLICDPELTPSQARAITARTDLKVIDRTMLILDIFARHATSADGKLQVELAQLRYRLPHMVGRGTMMSRLMGGIGGRGPGESKLEIDRRRARQRITDLERRLRKLGRQRAQRRGRRQRQGVPVVAIVGYTNAGKSTLLNTITGSAVGAEDKLFATLDPTVRRIRFPRDREIVLLDTVGFIRDLPPALQQAFSATLEEIADADLLLHVVDASDPDRRQHVQTVETILTDLGAGRVPTLRVYNKCDLLDAERVAELRELDPAALFVQATDRRTTRPLVDAIEGRLWASGDHPAPPA